MIIGRSEYKGKPIIVFKRTPDDKFPFSFGINKARIILENIEEIKAFYEELKHTATEKKPDAQTEGY